MVSQQFYICTSFHNAIVIKKVDRIYLAYFSIFSFIILWLIFIPRDKRQQCSTALMKDTVNILYPHITIYIQAIDASTATDRLIVAILLPGFILAILSLNAVYARKNITATPVISRYFSRFGCIKTLPVTQAHIQQMKIMINDKKASLNFIFTSSVPAAKPHRKPSILAASRLKSINIVFTP